MISFLACAAAVFPFATPSDRGAPDSSPLALEVHPMTSPAGENSSLPNLRLGADGKHYLSWVESGEGKAATLYVSRLDGDAWSTPREIVSGTDLFLNWADFPSVHASKSGALIAHWLRRDGSKHGYDAEFSTSKDKGVSWSEPQTIHDDPLSGEHGFVSIAPLGDEAFGVMWLDGRAISDPLSKAKQMGLYFRRISATGELGEEQCIDPRVCDCCQTDLIATSNGGLLAAYRDRSATEIRDMSFLVFDGESWSEPKTIHADGWLIQGCPVNGPALASSGNRSSALWFTGAGEDGGRVWFATRTATSFGFPTRIDEGRPIGRVDLVGVKDAWLASWLEHTEAAFAEWRVRIIDSKGQLGEPLSVARVHGDRQSGSLRMAPVPGGCLVAWTQTGQQPQVRAARVLLKR